MQGVIFLLVALLLYFASDAILQAVERHLNRRLEHRTLIFFVLLLSLSLVTFSALRQVLAA